MLDIKDKNGNHIDFVTGDHILDMKTFQEKNPQDEMIEKIELLWDKDYISFDQATSHYSEAMEWERGEGDGCPVKGGVPFEEFPRWVNWLAITLYNQDNSTPESYERYEHLYTDKYFKRYMEGLIELFGFDNLENFLEHMNILQLFLTPSAPQYKERDRFDLQCEHESVQVEEDFTPREIGRPVESSRWKHWTPHRFRTYITSYHTGNNYQPYGYHHDPYNLMWLKLSNTKRLMTRNIERTNVPIRSNSVIGFDGFMHAPDPTSWGVSMRLSFLDSFWETKNHKSEICKKLIAHVRSYRYTPIYPDHHYAKFTNLDFLDYSIKEDNKEFLDNEEYSVGNWQFYKWWESEIGKSFLDTAKEWLEKN